MSSASSQFDTIIIGAGLSGLAAGIRLAHYGQKVCICERHSGIGGLNSWYSRKGMLLETGLHAMTNLARRDDPKSLPLLKMLRQLRIPLDALQIREQNYSLIRFPKKTLKFDNHFQNFEASLADTFPHEIDNFQRLDRFIAEFNEVNLNHRFISARRQIGRFITDPLLTEMLLCPLFYYGSAVEDDMDFAQFAIMYKSIFRQGFFRPGGGIKALLELMEKRFIESGGELKLNCKVDEILVFNGVASGVRCANGDELHSHQILSSAGLPETQRLSRQKTIAAPGNLAFFETLAVFDKLDGHDETIIFFCNDEKLAYRRPETPVSLNSGVICLPHNFQFESGDFVPAPMLRTTVLSDYRTWHDVDYAATKSRALHDVLKMTGGMTGVDMNNAVFTDAFTPKTIERYTGRLNGAIYGSAEKQRNGLTEIEGLYICGTDQGFLGITGAALSGISIANLHLLLT